MLLQNISNESKLYKLTLKFFYANSLRVNSKELGVRVCFTKTSSTIYICSKYGAVILFFYIISAKWVIILVLSIYIFYTGFFKAESNFNLFPVNLHLPTLLTGFVRGVFKGGAGTYFQNQGVQGTTLFDHQGGTRHPTKLFALFFIKHFHYGTCMGGAVLKKFRLASVAILHPPDRISETVSV